MNEHDELNEILSGMVTGDEIAGIVRRNNEAGLVQSSPPSIGTPAFTDLCQWQIGPNGTFRPASKTIPSIPPGCYMPRADQLGPYLEAQPILSDEIVELPDTANEKVLRGIRKFWDSKAKYTSHGLLFKRGVLLWGPPGAGKTCTIHLLIRDLINNGGIVLFCAEPSLTLILLRAVRRIESERPIILILEDVDEIINRHGEHEILSLLDGEYQTDNIVFVATTNYPERLGARIVNRPSRFDERIMVSMPGAKARLAYLEKVMSNGAQPSSDLLTKWVTDTDGLSIAHLRELVAAVLCLDQDYDDVVQRLKSMGARPKDVDGFQKNRMGL